VVQLYTSGYLKQAQDSRDIGEYAYKRGAASLLDFLDAERSYRSVGLAYRQALASYLRPADCRPQSACAFLSNFSPLRSLK
jgi:outer membrane protein, heavy metal efflux system